MVGLPSGSSIFYPRLKRSYSSMRILVIGSGGREHALVWKISQSPRITKIYCAPGSAGISELAEPVAIGPEQIDQLADFAAKEKIDLTIVGPGATADARYRRSFRIARLENFWTKQSCGAVRRQQDVRQRICCAQTTSRRDPSALSPMQRPPKPTSLSKNHLMSSRPTAWPAVRESSLLPRLQKLNPSSMIS